ncbi:sugar transferase [uncultured Thiodictyon sp.]|uniref:sugar transferase n=1 Tax=uncultured Thiodictyon sp. TaxID=1846217 RepID=UPI0025E0DCC0|nr:sugar transferase [uncultured Thiodictyon sp.]
MTTKIDDRQLRELLIKRYAGIDRGAHRYLLKFYLKRIAWQVVVHSAHPAKRLLDIGVSSLLLVLLLPLFLLVALAIWLENPGPPLLQQTRVGRWSKPFAVWTFRSTWSDHASPGVSRPPLRSDLGHGDLRLTRIGALIGLFALPRVHNFAGPAALQTGIHQVLR